MLCPSWLGLSAASASAGHTRPATPLLPDAKARASDSDGTPTHSRERKGAGVMKEQPHWLGGRQSQGTPYEGPLSIAGFGGRLAFCRLAFKGLGKSGGRGG